MRTPSEVLKKSLLGVCAKTLGTARKHTKTTASLVFIFTPVLFRLRRKSQSSTADSAAHYATAPTGARPGSCCRERGAGLPAPFRLPIAPASCRREGIRLRH